jgi:hypothetical protein
MLEYTGTGPTSLHSHGFEVTYRKGCAMRFALLQATNTRGADAGWNIFSAGSSKKTEAEMARKVEGWD